jgi:hypothetical protein
MRLVDFFLLAFVYKTEWFSNLDSQERANAVEETDEASTSASKQFKPVCLIPRPWRYIDGLLNRPALRKMLEAIVLYLKSHPGARFDAIADHYCPVLQPIMTLELLEMLERLKCVHKSLMRRPGACDLFSDFSNGSSIVKDVDMLSGDEIASFFCTQNAVFILKKVFP